MFLGVTLDRIRVATHPSTLATVRRTWTNVTLAHVERVNHTLAGRFERAMKSVCVFCGSRPGQNPQYGEAAQLLGKSIAERGWRLIYGGGSIGLMGVVANAALAAGGEVVGVIPKFLATRELLHTGLTDLKIVPSMHVRKSTMEELADGFIGLPGGLGTIEELFEIMTWAQLGLHRKPIGLLNSLGYFDPLLQLVDAGIGEGFVSADHRKLILVERDVPTLLEQLPKHVTPPVHRWLKGDEV